VITVCSKSDCSEAECVELTERESSVCNVICASSAPISFGGLRESTGLHQEIVSRIVRRLLIHGLIRKADGRYIGECSQ
jgi:DNA-binding HxlR family transcriptional regulator